MINVDQLLRGPFQNFSHIGQNDLIFIHANFPCIENDVLFSQNGEQRPPSDGFYVIMTESKPSATFFIQISLPFPFSLL